MHPNRLKAARKKERFYTADPCATCSNVLRYVSNGKCSICVKARVKEQYQKDKLLLAGK